MVLQHVQVHGGALQAEIHPPSRARQLAAAAEAAVPVLGRKNAAKKGSRRPRMFCDDPGLSLQSAGAQTGQAGGGSSRDMINAPSASLALAQSISQSLESVYTSFHQTSTFHERPKKDSAAAVHALQTLSAEIFHNLEAARADARLALKQAAAGLQTSASIDGAPFDRQQQPSSSSSSSAFGSKEASPAMVALRNDAAARQQLTDDIDALSIGLAVWELAHILLFDIESDFLVPPLLAKWYVRHYFVDELRDAEADTWHTLIKLAQLDCRHEVVDLLHQLLMENQQKKNPSVTLTRDLETLLEFVSELPGLREMADMASSMTSPAAGGSGGVGPGLTEGKNGGGQTQAHAQYRQLRQEVQDRAKSLLAGVVEPPARELLMIYAGEAVSAQGWLERMLFEYIWLPAADGGRRDHRDLARDYLRIASQYAEEEIADVDEILAKILCRQYEPLYPLLQSCDIVPAPLLPHLAELLYLTGARPDPSVRLWYLSDYCDYLTRIELHSEALSYLDPIHHASKIRATFETWWASLVSDAECETALERVEADGHIFELLRQRPSVLESVAWARAHSCLLAGSNRSTAQSDPSDAPIIDEHSPSFARAVYWACHAGRGGNAGRVSQFLDYLAGGGAAPDNEDEAEGNTNSSVNRLLEIFCTKNEPEALEQFAMQYSQQMNGGGNAAASQPTNTQIFVRDQTTGKEYALPTNYGDAESRCNAPSPRFLFYAYYSYVRQKKTSVRDLYLLVSQGLCPDFLLVQVLREDLLPNAGELRGTEVLELVRLVEALLPVGGGAGGCVRGNFATGGLKVSSQEEVQALRAELRRAFGIALLNGEEAAG